MRRTVSLACVVLSLLILIQAGCATGGDYGQGDSSYDQSGSSNAPKTMSCPACGGGGACNMCYGSGRNPLDNRHRLPCVTCGGSGVCPRCHGRGEITY